MQYLHLQLSNISRYSVDLEVDLTNWNVINKETRRGFQSNFLQWKFPFIERGLPYFGTKICRYIFAITSYDFCSQPLGIVELPPVHSGVLYNSAGRIGMHVLNTASKAYQPINLSVCKVSNV